MRIPYLSIGDASLKSTRHWNNIESCALLLLLQLLLPTALPQYAFCPQMLNTSSISTHWSQRVKQRGVSATGWPAAGMTATWHAHSRQLTLSTQRNCIYVEKLCSAWRWHFVAHPECTIDNADPPCRYIALVQHRTVANAHIITRILASRL